MKKSTAMKPATARSNASDSTTNPSEEARAGQSEKSLSEVGVPLKKFSVRLDKCSNLEDDDEQLDHTCQSTKFPQEDSIDTIIKFVQFQLRETVFLLNDLVYSVEPNKETDQQGNIIAEIQLSGHWAQNHKVPQQHCGGGTGGAGAKRPADRRALEAAGYGHFGSSGGEVQPVLPGPDQLVLRDDITADIGKA